VTSFRKFGLTTLVLAAAMAVDAADVPNATVVLSVPLVAHTGQVAEAAPERFVMLGDGQVFVGGTSEIETCRLAAGELDAFLSEVDAVRKPRKKKRKDPGQPWLEGPTVWSFGGSWERSVLRFAADSGRGLPALRLELVGEPASAPPGLKPLGDLAQHLAEFDAPCLRPYAPASYRMRAVRGTLPGGCRAPGTLAPMLMLALANAVAVPANLAKEWPHGAVAAQVCDTNSRYLVTLTPLLPGEAP
jgi:hypothetical protein